MSLLPFDLSPTWVAHVARSEEWASWVDGLPRLVRDLLDEWDLSVDGSPVHGLTSLVVPVRTGGRPAVLKVARPHAESVHEILALQHWHGRGAALMLRADPRLHTVLIERLDTRDLTSVGDVEAGEIVAGLYGQLHVPAPPQLQTLGAHVRRGIEALELLPRSGPVPRRIIEQAIHLGRAFMTQESGDGVMLHGDLHRGNVLATHRDSWLAISPRPLSGDPHYEPAPLLGHRWDEVVASGDVRGMVRRRFHAVVDAAGLDEERARDWVIVREAFSAMRAIKDGNPDRVTRAMAIIKAVQD